MPQSMQRAACRSVSRGSIGIVNSRKWRTRSEAGAYFCSCRSISRKPVIFPIFLLLFVSLQRWKTQSLLAACDPAPDMGPVREIKTALLGKAGIRKKRKVGDAETITDEPIATVDHPLHEVERGFSADHPDSLARFLRLPEIDHLETADRDIGLVAVLLPEHELVRLGFLILICRHERAAAREMPQNRVRLRQVATIIKLDHRHLAHRVHLQ